MKIKVVGCWEINSGRKWRKGEEPSFHWRKSSCNKIYYDSIYNWLMMTSMRGGCGWLLLNERPTMMVRMMVVKRKLLFCSLLDRTDGGLTLMSGRRDAEIKTWKLHVWGIIRFYAMTWMEEGCSGWNEGTTHCISRLLFILIEVIVWETNTI